MCKYKKTNKSICGILCILVLFLGINNVWADSSGSSGSGGGGSGASSGDTSGMSRFDLTQSMGIRISVLKKDGNTYKTIASQDYYQSGFIDTTKNGVSGVTHVTKKSKTWHGSRYQVVKNKGTKWKNSSAKSNNAKEISWLHKENLGSVITELKNLLGSDTEDYLVAIDNLKNYLKTPKNKKVTLKKVGKNTHNRQINGMGLTDDEFLNDSVCESKEIFLLLEPMYGVGFNTSSGEKHYWGTVTEMGYAGIESVTNSISTISKWSYTTDSQLTIKYGAYAGQTIKMPFKATTSSGRNSNSWKYIAPSVKNPSNAGGYGVQVVWAGSLGEDCEKCYNPTIDAKELTKPVCKTGGQSLSVYQKMVEDKQKCSQLTPEQKQENSAAGVKVAKISGDTENNCTIYCKESITVNYPGKLNNKIEFGLGLKDKNVIWPDDKTYKMSLVGKKTCKFVVHGNMSDFSKCDIEINNQRAQNYYKDFATSLTLDYTDPVYGDGKGNINLNVTNNSKATCTGSCGKIGGTLTKERIEGREFTLTRVKTLGLDPKTSYSVFNHRSSRYEKLGERTVGDGYTNFKRGQLAISKESLEKDTEYKKNIKINTLGNFIKNGKVNGTSEVIPAYSCGYQVSAGNDCSSCYDSEGKKHNICCLASNSAEAMDKYCPNGVMDENAMKKDQIDPEKVKQDKACSCDGKANYSGEYDMTDCLQKQMKAGKNYQEAYAACLNTDPFKTYCCVNCAKVYYCPPPLTSKQIPASCVEEYGLDYCKRAYCTVCENDRSQDNNMRECMLSGIDENDCKIKYCHSYCILKDGTKKDISSCMADKKDYNLCSIEAGCPTSITCGDLGVTNGTKNIDITFCLESYSAQQCKNTYCSNKNVCPSNSDHPGRVIGPEDISKYGSLTNAIKELCNDCPNCVKVMFCTDRNHKQINMTTCYNKKLMNGINEVVAENECTKEYCPKDGDMFLYRTIDLKNPFMGSSLNGGKMTSRSPGENWGDKTSNNTNSLAYKYIVKDADTLYRQTDPMYTIDLGASTIQSIRQYNNDHEYNDYRMECDRNGNNCISKFLKENTVGMSINGKCKVTTSGALQNCMK